MVIGAWAPSLIWEALVTPTNHKCSVVIIQEELWWRPKTERRRFLRNYRNKFALFFSPAPKASNWGSFALSTVASQRNHSHGSNWVLCNEWTPVMFHNADLHPRCRLQLRGKSLKSYAGSGTLWIFTPTWRLLSLWDSRPELFFTFLVEEI